MFITLEAGDGAGKSTQARRLAAALTDRGHDLVLTREPGGSPGADEIRRLVLEGAADRWSAETELLLFTAARRDHVERVIQPALDRGKIVICDRYVGSTYALQGAGGVAFDRMKMLFDTFVGLVPDLTLFQDIDPEAGLERSLDRLGAAGLAEGRFESKGLGYHRCVVASFRHQCRTNPEWVRVEAGQSIEDVHAEILDIVLAHSKMRARQDA